MVRRDIHSVQRGPIRLTQLNGRNGLPCGLFRPSRLLNQLPLSAQVHHLERLSFFAIFA